MRKGKQVSNVLLPEEVDDGCLVASYFYLLENLSTEP